MDKVNTDFNENVQLLEVIHRKEEGSTTRKSIKRLAQLVEFLSKMDDDEIEKIGAVAKVGLSKAGQLINAVEDCQEFDQRRFFVG